MYKQGKISRDDIDEGLNKAVTIWRRSTSKESLHDYLGMTWEEYARWATLGKI